MEIDESLFGYGMYTMDEFEFENGEVLKEAVVEYVISGTPKYDDDGNVSNVVVYCHSYAGSCYSVNDVYRLTSENAPFDRNNYLIISITSLGFPESCSPSTTGLKYNFPKYSALDCVNFKKQFLKEYLGIEKFFGVTGRGIGGYEVYCWACEYPDDMKFIMVCDSSFKTNGYRYTFSKAIDGLIESSEGFYSDTYCVSLSQTVVSVYRLIYSNYFSKKILQEMSNDEIDVLMDDFVEEGLFNDIYDLKLRNDYILGYNLEDKLKNIKVPTLVFAHNDDVYYSYKYDCVPLGELIDDVEIVLYDMHKNSDGSEHQKLIEDALEFIKKIEE